MPTTGTPPAELSRLAHPGDRGGVRPWSGWAFHSSWDWCTFALIAPHYFVGSFDDDSGYILAARALLDGHGLNWEMASGYTVSGAYPPGFPALLVPLLWIWPHTFLPLRLLSTACYVALFPLLWVYLGRRRVSDGVRMAALFVLALGPPLATFGSMVMAETPFLVLLLVLLLLMDRWDRDARVFSPAGVAVVLTAAGLVWLKEAGVGVVLGLILWLLLPILPSRSPRQRRDRLRSAGKAAAVAAGTLVLLLPVAVARLNAGVPVAGSRYSQELGAYYQGGWLGRLIHVAPHGLERMLSTALPATLVPYLTPLPIAGHDVDLWKALSWQVTLLTVLGGFVWARPYRDAAITIVPVYLLETLFWPEVNERRVILVVPVLAAWYVLGAKAVWDALRQWVSRRGRTQAWQSGRITLSTTALAAAGAASVMAAITVVPLAVQLPRDYLVALGQDTSHFEGSPYVMMLRQLGRPADIVETDYVSSTALFTGHDTHGLAFTETLNSCNAGATRYALGFDDAAFLLVGDLNKPGVLDSGCLLAQASSAPWAVQLLHSSRDNAYVFELIGPGTGHPDLRDLTAGVTETSQTGPPGVTIREWDWSRPGAVTQVSVGQAGAPGTTTSVTVQLRDTAGAWRTVASARSAVGDGRGSAPFLLANLPAGTAATAMRVVVAGPASATTPPASSAVGDIHVLGPGSSA